MRKHKRIEIESPVTVGIRNLSNGGGLKFGRLRDISPRGARFSLRHHLPLGAEISLLVHFSNPYNRVTTVRFEGTVTRVGPGPPYEIAVRFRSGMRMFQGGLGDFLRRHRREKNDAHSRALLGGRAPV